MTIGDFIAFLAAWGAIGAFLFSLVVIFVFRSGIVYIARKQDGTLKDKVPFMGLFVMAIFLVLVVGFFVAANVFGLRRFVIEGFVQLFYVNFSLFAVLFLFDSLVIDWLVLGKWRPGFLRQPAEMGSDSMREHITSSFLPGAVLGLVIAAVSTAVSWYLVFQ